MRMDQPFPGASYGGRTDTRPQPKGSRYREEGLLEPDSPGGHWYLHISRRVSFLVLSPPWGRELDGHRSAALVGGTWHADISPLPLIRPSATFSPTGEKGLFSPVPWLILRCVDTNAQRESEGV